MQKFNLLKSPDPIHTKSHLTIHPIHCYNRKPAILIPSNRANTKGGASRRIPIVPRAFLGRAFDCSRQLEQVSAISGVEKSSKREGPRFAENLLAAEELA